MNSPNFQLNKVRRHIRASGRDFTFIREGTDSFGEPNGMTESFIIRGIYHETNINSVALLQNNSDAATIWPKKIPSMLCLWEFAQQVKLTDLVTINSKRYKISQVRNLYEANIVADILMEEVQEIAQ